MSTAESFSVTDARNQLATIIDTARSGHRPIFMTRRGQRVAAVIDADDLARLMELAEDMADIRAAEASRAEMKATGDLPIPWEQVKADLGLS
jgi:prevent-host-death family protein